jgi:hypothetical protein
MRGRGYFKLYDSVSEDMYIRQDTSDMIELIREKFPPADMMERYLPLLLLNISNTCCSTRQSFFSFHTLINGHRIDIEYHEQ